MKKIKTTIAVRYYTWRHNIDDCLRNGSFVKVYQNASLTKIRDNTHIVQYMNGDYMGAIDKVPDNMIEVDADKAKELLPKCCNG